MREIETIHRDIQEGPFCQSLPENREDLYTLLHSDHGEKRRLAIYPKAATAHFHRSTGSRWRRDHDLNLQNGIKQLMRQCQLGRNR